MAKMITTLVGGPMAGREVELELYHREPAPAYHFVDRTNLPTVNYRDPIPVSEPTFPRLCYTLRRHRFPDGKPPIEIFAIEAMTDREALLELLANYRPKKG